MGSDQTNAEDSQIEPGQDWAYRARRQDPLVQVVVRRHGTAKPARVLVAFVGEEFEGKEEWVPPARLKIRWAAAPRIRGAGGALGGRRGGETTHPGDVLEAALSAVFDRLIDDSTAALLWRTVAVTRVHDTVALCEELGLEQADLEHPAGFTEGTALIVPAPVTELIVRTAVRRNPQPVLDAIRKEELEVGHTMVHGTSYRAVHEMWRRHRAGGKHSNNQHDRECYPLDATATTRNRAVVRRPCRPLPTFHCNSPLNRLLNHGRRAATPRQRRMAPPSPPR